MKNIGKKFWSFLLAALMIVSLLSTTAFAAGTYFSTGPYEKSTVDNCFNQAVIPKVNDTVKHSIVGDVSGEGNSSSSVITITDADYNAQDACVEIVGNLLENLYNEAKGSGAISKIKPASANPGTCLDTCPGPNPDTCLGSDGSMNFESVSPSLTGDFTKDKATITQFCFWLGIMQVNENKLSELDGKAFAFEIVHSSTAQSSPDITYTFTFALPKLEVKPDESGKVEIDAENKTVTGTDLVDNETASGKTVTEVTDMFKDVASELSAEIKVYDKDNKPVDDNSAKVGTGFKVELVADNGSVLDYVVVVVMGDVSGDGEISITDATAILDDIADVNSLEGVFAQAAQVAGKGITVTDATRVLDIAANANN